MLNFKLASELLLIAAIAFSFVFLFSSYVPFNMDEFTQYHVLSCRYYPLNMLNTFRESCTRYDLAPIGCSYLPLRSYAYVGSLTSLIYYPLFRIWPSPYSARLLGLIMLAIQAYLIYKLFKVDFAVAFLLLLSYMPYAFMHVVDVGPAAFQMTSLFLICYLAQKKKHPLFIGVIILLGIWVKITYFFILPGLFILIFYFAPKEDMRKVIRYLAALFITIAIPALIILNSKTRDGVRLYCKAAGIIKAASVSNFSSLNKQLLMLGDYFINPLKSAHFTLKIKPGIEVGGILLTAVILGLLFFGIVLCRRRKIKTDFIIINISAFILTFFMLAVCSKTWGMHHLVLCLPFLILPLFYIGSKLYKDKIIIALIIAFLALNIRLYFDLAKLEPRDDACCAETLRLNNLLNERYAKGYVFIVIDWGMYYIKALYGDKDQCVLYIEPFDNAEEVKEVKAILNRIKRKALFIGRVDSVSDLTLIRHYFPGLTELKTDFDTGKWRAWYQK